MRKPAISPDARRRSLAAVLLCAAMGVAFGSSAVANTELTTPSPSTYNQAATPATARPIPAAPAVALPTSAAPTATLLPPTTPDPSSGTGTDPSSGSTTGATDKTEGFEGRASVTIPKRISLYVGRVSIIPGENLELHVSTIGQRYSFTIKRLDATRRGGGQILARVIGRRGHDFRSRITFDRSTGTARANWPVTDVVRTKGWDPGVYVVTARDDRKTVGQAIFVVRNRTLVRDRPAFVFTALTYQAYNFWGGGNLYGYLTPRATRVSFDRPYALERGKGYWTRQDEKILAWLQLRGLPLQYTTDYDLSVRPPAVAPKLLVFPRHAEYVTATLRDWVELHVNTLGDMNVANYGANWFFWQVRLEGAPRKGLPLEVVCYKSATDDPVAAASPALSTSLWRDPPLNRPEGATLGSQYVGVIGDGFTRYDATLSPSAPADLLEGTDWSAGTRIRGIILGEADAAYPGSGAIAVMDGLGVDRKGVPIASTVTVWTSPAGARVFDAGTYGWGDTFVSGLLDLGVPWASFERFNRNLLAWLGSPALR